MLHRAAHLLCLKITLRQQRIAAREGVGQLLRGLRMFEGGGAQIPAHGFARIEVDAFAATVRVAEQVHRFGHVLQGGEAEMRGGGDRIGGLAVTGFVHDAEVIGGLRVHCGLREVEPLAGKVEVRGRP